MIYYLTSWIVTGIAFVIELAVLSAFVITIAIWADRLTGVF